MAKTLLQNIFKKLFTLMMVLSTNLLILLSVVRNVLKYGKEYFESPVWIPMPKFLMDPKYGVHKIAYLKNINLHYVESGNPDKPLIMMVHGYPEFWYSWHHQITEFQKDYRVVAVSLRGYCLSDKPQDVESYKVTTLVEDLKQLADHLGVSRFTLMGHDWGGIIVWAFAYFHPDLLDRVIVMNAPHKKAFRDVSQKGVKQLLCSWYIFFYQMPYFPEWFSSRMNMKFVEDLFTSANFGLRKRTMTPAEIAAYKANMSHPGALTAAINFYRAVFRYPVKVGSTIEPKTLLIWGTEDKALTIELAETCRKYCSHLTIKYMDGASHWVQQDMPEEVNAAIREFLSEDEEESD